MFKTLFKQPDLRSLRATLAAAVFALFTFGLTMTQTAAANDNNPTVVIETSEGDIFLKLNRDAAPVTVANFLQYAESGHYAGTVFHRVIRDFMVQGGGHDETMAEKPTRDPIPNEANNGLSNARGTIAMARTQNPHSATAQFFINHGNNARLDFSSETMFGWGYAVFGEVVSGMDVVDKIAELPTGPMRPFPSDVPSPLVRIHSVREVEVADASRSDGVVLQPQTTPKSVHDAPPRSGKPLL